MKRLISVFLAAVLLLSLAGCSRTKSYTCQELTMEIPSSFQDHSGEESTQKYTFTVSDDDLVIFGLREAFTDFPDGGPKTLEEYSQLILTANDTQSQLQSREGKQYVYFTFEKTLNNKQYRYIAAMFQAKDAFWLVQTSTYASKFNEETCLRYLDTISFSEN